MSESRTQRSGPILPPLPAGHEEKRPNKSPDKQPEKAAGRPEPVGTHASAPVVPRPSPRSRKAHLRLQRIDAWSVMKTAFLLSIAVGIVTVVAVGIIWGVLGAAGVWDSINSIVQQALGSDSGTQFEVQNYVGTSRVLGFTMIVAVVDVILITALSTLAAFLYNLAATLVGGVEVTLSEDH
jgi:hypothetical protein